MKYEKGSFITVPSRNKLKGLHPIAQCLYMWLCSYANETGNCFPSIETLATNCRSGHRTIQEMLEILIKEGLVKKEIRSVDGKNLSNLYTVIVVGVQVAHEEGAGGAPVGVQVAHTELNPILTQSTKSVSSETPLVIISDSPQKDKSYQQIFNLFSVRMQGWMTHKPQKDAAKRLLVQRGLKQVENAVAFYKEHKTDKYCPQVRTPFELEEKWSALIAHQKRV